MIPISIDSDNCTELKAYIVSTTNNDGRITIHCGDTVYLLRQEVKSRHLKNVTVVDIAQQVVSEAAPGLEVVAGEGVSDIKFSECTIVDATAWDVLSKLRTQGLIARGKKLYLSFRA